MDHNNDGDGERRRREALLAGADLAQSEIHPCQAAARECPRCNSNNTKFCYYNNYNISQPRHFCKVCRRYWTHGGSLRNVPVGGSSRVSKRRRRSTDTPPPPSAGEIGESATHQQKPTSAETGTPSASGNSIEFEGGGESHTAADLWHDFLGGDI